MAFEQLRIDPQAEAIAGLYAEAERQLRASLEESLRSGRLGEANYRRRRQRFVSQLLDELGRKTLPRIGALLKGGFALGADIGSVGSQAGAASAEFGVGANQGAIDALVANLAGTLTGAINTVGRQTLDIFRRAGLRQAALGILVGTTYEDAAKSLQRDLMHQGVTGFVDKAGRRWTLENYSKMVIRTTTREAVSRGTHDGLLDMGQDLVKITKHLHPHDICTPYEGRTFSITGKTPGYPVLDQWPPFHPQCVHVAVPASDSFDNIEAELKAEGYLA